MLSAAPGWAAEKVIDRILVKINDSIITQYELDEELRPVYEKIKDRQLSGKEQEQLSDLRKKALDNLINDVLIRQEVERFGINVSEEQMDKEIERVRKERDLTLEDFEKVVAEDGLSMEEFRVRLKKILEKQELIGHMVTSKVLVTDTEIQEEYESRSNDYTMDKMVELGIVLLPAEIPAVKVRDEILAGKITFAEAVEKYSVGPGKGAGGTIGELSWADLAAEWKDALKGVQEGGVSTPLIIQGQESLLSPIKLSENRMIPLADVRDDIYKEMMQQRRESLFMEYFEKLKKSSVIIYMDNSLALENGVSQ